MGKVLALCISETKGVVKNPIESVEFIEDYGIAHDAHAGQAPLRQVSLLAIESVDLMRDKIPHLKAGDFAENILVGGLEVKKLPLGTRIRVGKEVLLEVTQIGKKCHNAGCAIKRAVGTCIMPAEGIFAKVVKGGIAYTEDSIEIVS